MAEIVVRMDKCTRCGVCIDHCPFGAMAMGEAAVQINAACRVCGLCVKACPEDALTLRKDAVKAVDKSAYRGILVYGEVEEGALHPVTLELIGKALELAEGRQPIYAALASGDDGLARELLWYGVDQVLYYPQPELTYFLCDLYANMLEDAIGLLKPAVVLVGATPLGRSLAPRVATRMQTGLTADCTQLELRENSDLVQIRPAFGGNIMAQILTPNTRPQFATVREKVMTAAPRREKAPGRVQARLLSPEKLKSAARVVSHRAKPPAEDIAQSEVLVVGGRGLKKKEDLLLLEHLAQRLGGQMAVTRPLVEAGWAPQSRQIGISGRTVRPRLIFTFGVSGSIQFATGMKSSDMIVAVNSDPDAPIFSIAHVAVVGDLYEVLPEFEAALPKEAMV